MKKITLYLFFIPLFLAGCVNYNQVTNLETDNSGEMYIHYWTNYESKIDSALISEIGLFNEDSIRNKFSTSITEVEFTEAYMDKSDSTLHGKVKFFY